jgi:hypothetical protein
MAAAGRVPEPSRSTTPQVYQPPPTRAITHTPPSSLEERPLYALSVMGYRLGELIGSLTGTYAGYLRRVLTQGTYAGYLRRVLPQGELDAE